MCCHTDEERDSDETVKVKGERVMDSEIGRGWKDELHGLIEWHDCTVP